MSKNDNINIQLEVCRDKSNGKLTIMAHFNSKAPNVYHRDDGYYWIPTYEEKELINEAFELIPVDGSVTHPKPSPPKSEVIETPKPEPVAKKEPEIKEEKAKTEEEPNIEPKVKISEPDELPPLEKSENQDIFEVTEEQIKRDDIEKEEDVNVKEEQLKNEEEQLKNEESEDIKEDEESKSKLEEGIIVEADNDAIEAALKKHTGNDKSMVEADEQTIIDKVLSQKKKGKWSKR